MECLVRLNSIEDALHLVRKLEQQDCRADVEMDGTVIDAKSFMGLVALGLGRQLKLNIHGDKVINI